MPDKKKRIFRALRAFTMVELLIAILIVAILGGAFLLALRSFMSSYWQTEDVQIASEEIDRAFTELSKTIRNAGLGLPSASLDVVFYPSARDGVDPPPSSVMSHMEWPITVATSTGDVLTAGGTIAIARPGDYEGSDLCEGPVLYYAWSKPTGKLINHKLGDAGTEDFEDKSIVDVQSESKFDKNWTNFDLLSEDRGIWCGTELELRVASGDKRPTLFTATSGDVRPGSWIAFPTFGVPLYINEGNNAVVAPGAEAIKVIVGGMLNGLEEVHIVRAAKVYVDGNNMLVRKTYTTPPQIAPDNENNPEILATHVKAVWFQFNPETRTLRMYVAAQGVNVDPAYTPPDSLTLFGWPETDQRARAGYTGADKIIDGRHRLMVRDMTWRIKN